MQLSADQLALLPGEADIAFYEAEGYWVSPRVLEDDEIDAAIFGIERYYAGERDFFLYEELQGFEGWHPGDGEGQRVNDYVSLQNAQVSRLVRQPLIGAMAARLARTPTVRLWHDQLIMKPPDLPAPATGVGWHTDRAYWLACSSETMLTAWLPLQDCDEAIGPLMVVAGSHRWPGTERLRGFHATDGAAEDACLRAFDADAVPTVLTLKKGQVSFHHCRTVHGSRPNRSGRRRLSLSIHMQDAANAYRDAPDREGETPWHRNVALCRPVDGVPDYADPDICPVLWSAQARR